MSDKKDAYYFSHDSNARNDIKILRLRRSLGLEGYGIYFCLIELLREQDDFKMNLSSIPDIAFELHTSDEKLKTVIHSFDLFVIDENEFFSARLMRSMTEYKVLKNKLSEGGRKGGLKRAKAMLELPQSTPQALKERKVKEKKGNKIFIPPTLEEVKEYFKDNGYLLTKAETAYKHYALADWHDTNGKQVKNWKQKMNTVWFKDENKASELPKQQQRTIGTHDREYGG